jgi:hypothetical protein
MRVTMQEYSAARVGQEWRPEDHAMLVHHLAEIERTAVELVRRTSEDRELREAAGRRLQARENVARRENG